MRSNNSLISSGLDTLAEIGCVDFNESIKNTLCIPLEINCSSIFHLGSTCEKKIDHNKSI